MQLASVTEQFQTGTESTSFHTTTNVIGRRCAWRFCQGWKNLGF